MKPTSRFPTETDIQDYVDGRLDDTGSMHMEAWLARHPDLAARVQSWRRDAQELRAALGYLPAEPMPARLDPAIVRFRRRRRRHRHLAMAASLVLAIGVGGLGGWQIRNMRTPNQLPPMADAVQAYRLFALEKPGIADVAVPPVANVQLRLERYFPHAAALPNLAPSGFRLVDMRLLANAAGPAALILYKNAQDDVIGFYIRSPEKHADALPRGQRRDGQLATAYWSGEGYNYALVGIANAEDLQAMRRAWRRQS